MLCGDNSGNMSHASTFTASIAIIAILSPVAVVGNSLILAAIWKKTFQRTYFHVLLSGLAITDLCTGIIAQPLTVAAFWLYLVDTREAIDASVLYITMKAIANASTTYFISGTLLIIAVMSVERWLHMSQSRGSLATPVRLYVTAILGLLIPIPSALFRSLES